MHRLAARWLLAVALVVAQLGVHAHALSHLGKALYAQDGAVHHTDHDPASCLAFDAAAGGAVTPAALPVGGDSLAASARLVLADPLLPPLALARFASRAPPFHS